mgnify:CR=1 FL=1
MFPLRDSSLRKSFPWVNYAIIFLTIYVFILQLMAPNFEEFIYQYGFVAARFDLLNLSTYRSMIFSIFLHGGFFHLFSNLWFLHIFGDNVEDKMGHFLYLFFYLTGGVAAIFAQLIFNLGSEIPMIGASGAISAVAGAYFVMFKNSKIEALVPDFIGFLHIIELPSWFFLGYWFVLQVFSGLGSLVTFDIHQGGVAWFAHIGGFLYGVYSAKKLKKIVI